MFGRGAVGLRGANAVARRERAAVVHEREVNRVRTEFAAGEAERSAAAFAKRFRS